jgi:hypothetical protein
MAQAASIAAGKLIEFLSAEGGGVGAAIAGLAADTGIGLAPLPPEHIVNQNIPAALAEKSQAVKYPVVHVYSDRVRNLLTEKFRMFSGKVRTVAEVRCSQDRVDGIEEQLRLYVEAVTQVLDANRGSWGQGAYFAGAYEVAFDPVQQGGRNFLQIARVTFDVDLSS